MHKTYGLNWFEIVRRIFAGVACLGMLALFGGMLTRIQLGLNGETILLFVMSLLFLFGTGWSFQSVLGALWRNPRFQLHERGVTLITNDSEMDWDWDEFTHWSGKMMYHKLYGVLTLFISGSCELYSNHKPALSITGMFKDAPKLAGIIITQVMRAQLPKQVEAFQQGKTLEFGTVTLNQQGLQQDKTFIPFGDILDVSMNEYYFWVHLKSEPKKPARFTVGDPAIRTPELLLAVVQTLVRPSQAQ